jgi:hypothetical protein
MAVAVSAREAGAEAVVGGGRMGDRGYVVQPTILTNPSADMKVVREEIFGPVVCAIPFDRGGYDLPGGALALADSAVDSAPAFRFRRAYGVPFHLEADAEFAARCSECPHDFPTPASLAAGVAVLDAFARLGRPFVASW